MTPEELARLFHATYERKAPHFGYQTREESHVAWDEVPEPNRSLMVAVAGEVLDVIGGMARYWEESCLQARDERAAAWRNAHAHRAERDAARAALRDCAALLPVLRSAILSGEPINALDEASILGALAKARDALGGASTDPQATRDDYAHLAADGTVDERLYQSDPVYHALVYRVRAALTPPAPGVSGGERCVACREPKDHRNHEPIGGAYPPQWVITCHRFQPPAPAVSGERDIRPCLDCGAPVEVSDGHHVDALLDETHTPHVARWSPSSGERCARSRSGFHEYWTTERGVTACLSCGEHRPAEAPTVDPDTER